MGVVASDKSEKQGTHPSSSTFGSSPPFSIKPQFFSSQTLPKEMGSFVPFQDLNCSPSPPPGLTTTATATATATAAPLFKVPKLEPKCEPFDGSFEVSPSVPGSALGTFPYSQTAPLPPPPPSPGTPAGPISPTDEDALYSEYTRVSELFRAAFSQQSGEGSAVDLSLAIVPFVGDPAQPASAVAAPAEDGAVVPAQPKKRKYAPRSSELVRVSDLSEDDKSYFREVVRHTRMLFDALRIFTVVEEAKRQKSDPEEGGGMGVGGEGGQPAGGGLERGQPAGAGAGEGGMPAGAGVGGEGGQPAGAGAGGDGGQAAGAGTGAGAGGEGEPPLAYVRRHYRPRGDLMASAMMRNHELWLNRDKRIVGSIPGIEVGDVFFFRMELCVLGLHGQVQAGIDYLPGTRSSNGQPVATSIIVSGGYEDDEDAGDVLIYTGHGGQDKFSKQCMHQKLEGGNLALERSMHYGIEVRVIRGIRYNGSATATGKVYVYDGLYRINECWFDVGKSGFGVYKYKLMRIDGQAPMGSAILKFAQSLRTQPLNVRPKGYLSLDLSNKKENVPVLLFNDIDDYQDPLYFDYLPKTVFPPFVISNGTSGSGCDCVLSCSDGCFCASKNGGSFAYDHNGFLLRGKPLIFECGPFCQCPPGCRNRVTQRGLRHRLEVFRSPVTGWAVRSLDVIQAGTFICEYTGVILTREQAQIFAMNGDSLIYPSRFAKKWTEWGDLSQVYPEYKYPSHPSVPPLDFAMDVSRMRNVACYMSHSSTPNVMVQLVLYDHNNLMFPHLMLFALENIPPLTDLCLDYGVGVPDDECTGKLAICN